jgi:hypothetical protein
MNTKTARFLATGSIATTLVAASLISHTTTGAQAMVVRCPLATTAQGLCQLPPPCGPIRLQGAVQPSILICDPRPIGPYPLTLNPVRES